MKNNTAAGTRPIRRDQRIKIQIACKELGIEKEERYARTERLFGVRSCNDLTVSQAEKLIAEYVRMGWEPKQKKSADAVKPGQKKFDHLGHRPGMASPKMLRMIEAMWRETGDGSDIGLRKFVEARYHAGSLEFLTKDQAGNCIEAIKAMRNRNYQWPRGNRKCGSPRNISAGRVAN